MNWLTIDFEASCLPQHGRSYPIEVGICGPSGTRSWLIKPAREWRDWDWTEEAFRLHGITRDLLDEQGLDAGLVAAEVRRALGGARVIADSPIDNIWWNTLLHATDEAAAAPIVFDHVGVVLDELGATDEQIRSAQQRADRLWPQRHRAGADAGWLYSLLANLAAASDKTYPSWTTRDAYVRGQSVAKTVPAPVPAEVSASLV